MQATDITNLYPSAFDDRHAPGPDGLPWHWNARPAARPSLTPITVPGVRGGLALEHRGLFRSDRLWVDGRPAPRVDHSHAYWLHRADGELVEAHLRAAFGRTLPDLVIEGQVVQLGDALPAALVALVFLPLLLGAVFGWVGAVAGAFAVLFNRILARQGWGTGLKSVAMLTSFGGAAAVSMVGLLFLRVLALAAG